jgi:hypothetical protein
MVGISAEHSIVRKQVASVEFGYVLMLQCVQCSPTNYAVLVLVV